MQEVREGRMAKTEREGSKRGSRKKK